MGVDRLSGFLPNDPKEYSLSAFKDRRLYEKTASLFALSPPRVRYTPALTSLDHEYRNRGGTLGP